MQVEVKKIVEYCQEYLQANKWTDACVNGIQVEGELKASMIITGVSISQELIRTAIKKRSKLIIVHHGFFDMDFKYPIEISGYRKERLKLLLENNINLAGFHLPLDAHPVIGNNISLLKLLKLKKTDVISMPQFGDLGFVGEYADPVGLDDFYNLISDKLLTQPYVIAAGPKKIKRVGIVSGRIGNNFRVAKDYGVDTFVTGETLEETVRAVEETRLNYFAAGHYNTEKLGIQNLGEMIAKKFGIKHEFVDIPCEI